MTAEIIKDFARAQVFANKHNKLLMKIGEWFQKRYGCIYNEHDVDEFIDCAEYGRGDCPGSIEEIDAVMMRYGIEPLSAFENQEK